MAGKDLNTWKMKRKDKYEKPTAVRMSDSDWDRVSGGGADGGISDQGRHCQSGRSAGGGGCYNGFTAGKWSGCRDGSSPNVW